LSACVTPFYRAPEEFVKISISHLKPGLYSINYYGSYEDCTEVKNENKVGIFNSEKKLGENIAFEIEPASLPNYKYFNLLNSLHQKVTSCVLPNQNEKGQLLFDFTSPLTPATPCDSEKTNLIIWSLHKDFVLHDYRDNVEKSLISVFDEFRQSKKTENFEFNVIQANRKVPAREYALMSCKKLIDGAMTKSTFIPQPPVGSELRAMDDLSTVGMIYPSKKLQKILYITHDNQGTLQTELRHSQKSQIGIWYLDGIGLEVVTIGSCAPWQAVKVNCHQIDELDSVLRKFLLH